MEEKLERLTRASSILPDAVRMEQIHKGFSSDQKFRVDLANGEKCLLRVSPLSDWQRKQEEFAILKALESMGVKTSRPLEQGTADDEGLCFMVLSYVEGEDARDQLPQLSEQQQYDIGISAGRELALMHTLRAPASLAPWKDRCMQKHLRYVQAYHSCGYSLPEDSRLLTFIDEHLSWLDHAPDCFLHDDFHVGNLIVHNNRYAGAIDVNRFDWGDPVHDFTKLAFFSQECSNAFCHGQVSAYCEQTGISSTSFWLRYSVYTAMMMFSSVVWTIRVVPSQLGEMLERIHRILDEHDCFARLTPRWYLS